MIRHLHPTDSPGLLPFKQAAGPAEAYTLAKAIQANQRKFPAVKYAGIALSPRAWQGVWVQTRRTSIQAIVRAGPRSGPLAWEVRDLFMRRSFVPNCVEVLEQIAIPAGSAGALRVFLRLSGGSPVFEQARRAGYMAVGSETVYRADSSLAAIERMGVPEHAMELRAREKNDPEKLYRLYCASTPVDYRTRGGQTSPEWRDALEKPGRKVKEWVLDGDDGRADAWLQMAELSGGRYFSLTHSPRAAEDLRGLVAAAISEMGEDGPVTTLLPDHDHAQAALLEEVGFRPVQTFDVLVKLLAVQVKEARGAVAAIS